MKIIDENIFKEAVDELHRENIVLEGPQRGTQIISIPQAVPSAEYGMPKDTGFHIGATPGALIGALTGAIIASKKAKADTMRRQIEFDKNGPSLDGSYYMQAQNIAQNLKIIFTPLGVIYTVKNGTKETTIDTIETSEMNKDMYEAWKNKDYNYYKGLMLAKMYSEMQIVEQVFAKKFLEKQQQLQNQISKKAGINIVEETNEELSLSEILNKVADVKDLYGKHTETTEKIAEIIINSMENDVIEYVLPLELERPFSKYAGITSAFGFLGFNSNSSDIRSEQGKLLDPKYLNSKVKVGFMPDRVIYTVDGKLIGTLLAMNMNEDGFEHFQKLDKEYFRNFFKEEVKRGIAKMNEKPNKQVTMSSMLEKKASDNDIKQIFKRNDIHPVVYYLVLTQKYGFAWMTFDPYALITIIEKDFKIEGGIDAIPLNKILAIQVANNSDTCYESYHAFEKVMRSLCSKRVDFLKREISDVDINDIAFTMDVLDRVTPYDDIYDNFSSDIYDYLTDVITESETYVYSPTMIVGSPTEPQFNQLLNYSLLHVINSKMLSKINPDPKLEKETIEDNETVFDLSHMILDAVRKQHERGKVTIENSSKFISEMLKKLNVKERLRPIIEKQVLKNIALDQFLIKKEEELMEQLKLFGLLEEGGGK